MHDSGSTWLGRAVKLGVLVALVMLLAGRVRGFSLASLVTGDERPAVFSELTLDAAIAKPGALVVADYFAPWCGPCRRMDQTTWRDPSVGAWLDAHATAVQVNIDRDAASAARAEVRSIPTIIVFRDGRELARRSGYVESGELVRWLESVRDR